MVIDDVTLSSHELRHNPIDIHVGSRIRLRRIQVGMSQEQLGAALGLTFQQVQKYEKGMNRVGASRLFDLSRVLDVTIVYFFEDIPTEGISDVPMLFHYELSGQEEQQNASIHSQLTKRETLELVRAYYRIVDPEIRKRVADLMKSLGTSNKSSANKTF